MFGLTKLQPKSLFLNKFVEIDPFGSLFEKYGGQITDKGYIFLKAKHNFTNLIVFKENRVLEFFFYFLFFMNINCILKLLFFQIAF